MKLHSAFYSKQKEQKKKENYNKNGQKRTTADVGKK
jgi:hypothetical protein